MTNDGTNFAPRSTSSVAQMNAFLTNNFPNLATHLLDLIDIVYPQGPVYPDASSYWPPLAQAYGETRYRCPAYFLSDMISRRGVPSYNYHYNVLTPTSISSGYGVTHTIETNAIFGPTSSSPSNYLPNSSFVLAMQGYWTSFIRSKDPNLYRYPGSAVWQQWQPWYAQSVIVNNNNTAMEPYALDLRIRCAFWNTIGVSLQQ